MVGASLPRSIRLWATGVTLLVWPVSVVEQTRLYAPQASWRYPDL